MFEKLKDGVSVIYRPYGALYEVAFLHKATGIIQPFYFTKAAFRCLPYLNGRLSAGQLAQRTGLPITEVAKALRVLRKAGLLCDRVQTRAGRRTRFDRQLNFFADLERPWLSRTEMQSLVSQTTVAVVGLGGIGSWVAYGLALLGVRRFILIDPDKVDSTNLHRSALFYRRDIGKRKTSVVAKRLRLLDPGIACKVWDRRMLTVEQCRHKLQGARLAINCADEPSTDAMNRLVTKACFRNRIPHILCGGYDGHLGFLGPTVVPGESACWFCYERALDRRRRLSGYQYLPVTAAEAAGGTLGALAAIIANLHVLEAMKVLTGSAKPSLLNGVGELNVLTLELSIKRFRRVPGCTVCGTRR